jgi:adenylate cyclase
MSRVSKALIAGVLTGLSGVVFSLLPSGLHLEENMGLGLLFHWRGSRTVPSDVVIVTMDKVSSQKLRLPTDPEEWPRSFHALLTEKLTQSHATVVAFDMFFDKASSQEEDRLFAQAIEKASNVVLCECLKKETLPVVHRAGARGGDLNIERLIPPIDPLRAAAVAVAPFPLPKVPLKVSQYWTFKTGAGDKPTLPVVAFQVHALQAYGEWIPLLEELRPGLVQDFPRDKDTLIRTRKIETLIRTLRDAFKRDSSLGDKALEILEKEQGRKTSDIIKALVRMYQQPDSLYLDFYGPPGTIPTVSYYEALGSPGMSASPERAPDFSGKAVFVGLSERLRPEQKDGFYTAFSQPSGIDLSGVEIAATAFANLLESRTVQPVGPVAHVLVIALWGLVLGMFCRFFPTPYSVLCTVGLGGIYLMAAVYQFKQAGHWYPLVIPLFFQAPVAFFGTLAWKYFDTNQERQNIRKAFGYYLPNRVVDQLARNMADVGTAGQNVFGTCLFTDAGKYTTLAETMDPKELRGFMGKYYEALFEPVRRHGGIVINVVGDSMLAVWTSPHPNSDFRNQACLAALEIADAAERFNRASSGVDLPTRIGLHSGRILLGNVGAADHYEYRPIGDIVNTASRMEGLNKYLGTRILVTSEVLDQLTGFLTREMGKFLLAGKSRPVAVHELVCRMETCTPEEKRLHEIFAEGLEAYRRQSWDRAVTLFEASLRIQAEDGPSVFFLKLCEEHRENPPGGVWNGLVRLQNK